MTAPEVSRAGAAPPHEGGDAAPSSFSAPPASWAASCCRWRRKRAVRPWRSAGRRRRGPPQPGWLLADLASPGLTLPPASQAVAVCPIWLLPPALPALERAGREPHRRHELHQPLHQGGLAPRPPNAPSPTVSPRSEEALAAFCLPRSIAWTVLRPTLIYAEGLDSNVSRLAALIRRFGVLPILRAWRRPAPAGPRRRLGRRRSGRAGCDGRSRQGLRRPRGRNPQLSRHGGAGVRGAGTATAHPLPPAAPVAGGAGAPPRRSCRAQPPPWATAWRRIWCSIPPPATRDLGWSPRPLPPIFRRLTRPRATRAVDTAMAAEAVRARPFAKT